MLTQHDFYAMIIRYCSPTLAGLKTGNLFTVEYDEKKEFIKEIREFNERLKNKGIRIIALSATLQNMDEMAHWLEAEVVTHDYRPVPLHKEVLCAEEFGTKDKNNLVFKILNDLAINFSLIRKIVIHFVAVIVLLW